MTYYASFPYSSVNNAAQALQAQYGSRVGVEIITQPAAGTDYVLQIDSSDTTITADDISSAITNAIGSYASVTGTGTPSSGSNMGAFLNDIGDKIRKAFANWKFPSLNWLWWIVAAIVVLLFVTLFTAEAGRGFGAGVAAKV